MEKRTIAWLGGSNRTWNPIHPGIQVSRLRHFTDLVYLSLFHEGIFALPFPSPPAWMTWCSLLKREKGKCESGDSFSPYLDETQELKSVCLGWILGVHHIFTVAIGRTVASSKGKKWVFEKMEWLMTWVRIGESDGFDAFWELKWGTQGPRGGLTGHWGRSRGAPKTWKQLGRWQISSF